MRDVAQAACLLPGASVIFVTYRRNTSSAHMLIVVVGVPLICWGASLAGEMVLHCALPFHRLQVWPFQRAAFERVLRVERTVDWLVRAGLVAPASFGLLRKYGRVIRLVSVHICFQNSVHLDVIWWHREHSFARKGLTGHVFKAFARVVLDRIDAQSAIVSERMLLMFI